MVCWSLQNYVKLISYICVMDEINTLKSINHAWCCDEGKCNCDNIDDDSSDLGNRIIQEMWDKEKRFINSKNKTK